MSTGRIKHSITAIFVSFISFAVLAAPNKDAETNYRLIDASNGKSFEQFTRQSPLKKFYPEQGLTGEHNYIVRLEHQPVATYHGDIADYEATAPGYANEFKQRLKAGFGKQSFAHRQSLKLDFSNPAVKKYQQFLATEQQRFVDKSSTIIGGNLNVTARMTNAFNGVVLNLTQAQAMRLAEMSEVTFIEREQVIQLDTDRGPELIGAPNVWDATATGTNHYGEGTIVGIIDSGINSDHPSFAAESGDGYVHTNPLGDGVYIGDCEVNFPEMCNSKLIGVRSYPRVTDIYQDTAVFGDTPPPANGEDYDGHGTHVASTAAGNLLINLPLYAAERGAVESDGLIATSNNVFPQVTGVAPRANIIAYQVCAPGASGDTYSGCYTSTMLQAIEDSITDGVDALNMSISGGSNPWSYSIAQAFLAAQEAGIFVAISAGNSGPEPATTVKNAPWYSSVAASTHGRTLSFNTKTLSSLTGGSTTPPSTISGSGATPGLTAAIVYAGDFANPNDPDNDSAQCLEPFPEGTFSGQIVVCDRGEIARVQKAANVAAGGAGGYILANVPDGATNLANDTYVVPGIQISAADGTTLKTWLATGSDHTGTINASSATRTIGSFDRLAGFSSRGPNITVPDVMVPTVAAPGVSIYAAYADQQFGHDVTAPTPTDFSFLQGTSMASPHVAGAGALLKSVHPSWTPDNIRSALMMTAERSMVKEDGATAADIFDMGSGRINVDLAAKTGLVMDESAANYQAANPATGGDPKTLNIPSMGNTQCTSTCTWTREVTATRNASWTLSTQSNNPDITFSVSPATFTLTTGESQVLTITASSSGASSGSQAIGYINLTSSDADIPDLHMPAFVTVNTTNLPESVAVDIRRNSGAYVLRDTTAIAITDLTARVYGLQKATITEVLLPQDSDNSTPFDSNTDGVLQTNVTLNNDSPLFWINLAQSTADDMDLFVGLDTNGDGLADESELLCSSISPTSDEVCELENAVAGDYWILVQNYTATEQVDSTLLRYAYVPETDAGNLTVSSIQNQPAFVPFDITLSWSDDMQEGDVFLGAFDLATDSDPGSAGNLGRTIVVLNRIQDDVSLSFSNTTPAEGDRVTVTVDVLSNRSDEAIDYTIDALIPLGLTVDETSIATSDGSVANVSSAANGTQVSWSPSRAAYDPSLNTYLSSTSVTDSTCQVPNLGQGSGYLDLEQFGVNFNSMDGDEGATRYAIPFKFLDTVYDDFYISANGIITLGAAPPNTSFVHQRVPLAEEPNNLVAPLWRDFQLSKETGSGVSVASAGPWIIVEFDDMRPFSYYDGDTSITDMLDFEMLINSDTGDFYFAYANVTQGGGDDMGGTIGWENGDGTSGDYLIYVGGLYDDGLGDNGSFTEVNDTLVVCYEAITPNSDPLTLTFDVIVDAGTTSQTLTTVLTSDVSLAGGMPESSEYDLRVGGNIVIDPRVGTLNTQEDTPITITVNYTSPSANNTITVTADSGTVGELSSMSSGAMFDITPDTDFNGTIAATITITSDDDPQLSATDSFLIEVLPVNDPPTVTATSSGSSTVTLTANASDVDSNNLTYNWTQTAGPTVTISNADQSTATVSNANATSGTLTFQVTVSDGEFEVTASTSITVTAPPPPQPPSNGGGGGGGSTGPWTVMVLMMLFIARLWRNRSLSSGHGR